MKYANIYYFNSIQPIGGIETFFYELAKKYNDYDLTIVYKQADKTQLKRLKKYIRCIKYKQGDVIECDKAFFNFNTDIIDYVKAKEYCLVVHGDYKMLYGKPPTHPKINKYYGVSKVACDSFTELTGLPCELVYNPINVDKPTKVVHLCSASRLDDKVKGGNRTKALIKALDNYCEATGYKYIWTIFTHNVSKIDSKNVAIMNPRLDISSFIADADYMVQLSDNFEGYNYTLNEGLVNKTPFIATPCNVYKELGMDETMGIWVDFDLSNINKVVEDIFSRAGTFEINYKPPADNWGNIFINKKSTYKEELKMRYKVEALDTYTQYDVTDKELNKVPKAGEVFEVSKDRLDVLLGENDNNRVYVKVLEEIKPKVKKTTKK